MPSLFRVSVADSCQLYAVAHDARTDRPASLLEGGWRAGLTTSIRCSPRSVELQPLPSFLKAFRVTNNASWTTKNRKGHTYVSWAAPWGPIIPNGAESGGAKVRATLIIRWALIYVLKNWKVFVAFDIARTGLHRPIAVNACACNISRATAEQFVFDGA